MDLHLPLILDGATGTELQKRGFDGSVSTEQWVLAHPEAIQEIQVAYIEAGSNIIYSPTFGANRIKLGENGVVGQTAEYNKRLASFSKEIAGGRAWVAADLAPTGKMLSPLGDATFEELYDVYYEQAAALEEAGVDLFVVETTMTVPEARAAVLAIKNVSKKPVFVTFTCDTNGRTLTGTDITAALVILQNMGVDAFGLNCSVGPEDMVVQLRRLSEYAEVPLIAKPNAGLPELENGKTVYRCTPAEFSSLVNELADAGVGIFGGCCGTTSEHIRALKQAVDQTTFRSPAPKHSDMLNAATEKEVFLLSASVSIPSAITCDENLADKIEEACDDSSALIAIAIHSEADAAFFAAEQYAITKPLCIVCDDAILLEQALRSYQGRALYDGTLPDEILLPLQKKYGLII